MFPRPDWRGASEGCKSPVVWLRFLATEFARRRHVGGAVVGPIPQRRAHEALTEPSGPDLGDDDDR